MDFRSLRLDRTLARAGGISRRAFNTGLLGAGMAGLMPSPLLLAQEPRRGGHVRLALTTQTTDETYDPARYNKSSDYMRGRAVYSYLTKLDERGQAVPEVATEWEPNADATVWRFKVRDDILFSDGKPLTTADMIYSIMRHKDENVASSAKQLMDNVTSVTADGPDGLTVELAAPDVDLPILLGLFQFALLQDGTTEFTQPIGTGAFTVTEFQPGLRHILDRNPNYWKEGRPYIDRLEMFPIPDATARAHALMAGDIEIALEIRGNAIQEVEAAPNTEIFVTPSTRYTAIQARMDQPPSNIVDLTMAMAYLMDRERMLNTVLRGYGTIANDHIVGQNSPLFNAELPQREFDPDRAKSHFEKSGIGNTPIELSVSDAAIYSVEYGQLLQREAMQIGMNLQLRREPAESYWTAVAGVRPYAWTNFHPRPTYNMFLDLAFRKGAVWNFSHYSNDRLESLINESRATLDPTLRKEQFAEIQTIIHNSGAILIPCFLSYLDGISTKVKGLTPLPIGNLHGFDFADRIWLEA